VVIGVVAKHRCHEEVLRRVIDSAVISIVIILGAAVFIGIAFIFEQVCLPCLVIAGKATVTPILLAMSSLFFWGMLCREAVYFSADIILLLSSLAMFCVSKAVMVIPIASIPTRSVCPVGVVYTFAGGLLGVGNLQRGSKL
jgi:hypothetical protein